MAWTGAGGDGVLYALTTAGVLRWYRYDTAKAAWMPGSGNAIGSGFVPCSKVVGITVGANGWLYVVRSDGRLALYQHTGRLTGAATWSNSAGYVIGNGFTGKEILAHDLLALGGGVLLATSALSGQVTLYQHADPAGGAATWVIGGGLKKYLARSDSVGISMAPNTCS